MASSLGAWEGWQSPDLSQGCQNLGVKNINSFSHSNGCKKSKIKVSAGLCAPLCTRGGFLASSNFWWPQEFLHLGRHPNPALLLCSYMVFLCVYAHTCVCACTCLYVSVGVYMPMCPYSVFCCAHVCACMRTCVLVYCPYIYVCVCVYVCIYLYGISCMFTCACTYMYISLICTCVYVCVYVCAIGT